MPIYEYKCKKCGKEFEVMQKFSDDPVKKCEDCSGPVEKMISQSSFVLKGSGWHKTDYPDNKKPAPSSCDVAKESSGTQSADCAGCPAAGTKSD